MRNTPVLDGRQVGEGGASAVGDYSLQRAIQEAGGIPPGPDWASSRWLRGAGWRRSALRLAALVLVALSLYLDPSVLAAVAVLFVVVVPMEKLFPRHRGQRVRRPGWGTDVAYALFMPLSEGVAIVVALPLAVATLAWLPGLALRPLVGLLPPAAKMVVGFLLFDLTLYWVHRWSHEIPLLWRFHQIHHSPKKLDWISGFRNHPFDGALVSFPLVALLAAGFDLETTGVLAALGIAVGLFLHANVRWRLRPLWRIVMTPEFHHWHHSNTPDAFFTNYSITVPWWDILFGTYRMPVDQRPGNYGINDPVPDGIVAQLALPLRGAPKVRSILRHPWRSVRAFYRGLFAVAVEIWAVTRRGHTVAGDRPRWP